MIVEGEPQLFRESCSVSVEKGKTRERKPEAWECQRRKPCMPCCGSRAHLSKKWGATKQLYAWAWQHHTVLFFKKDHFVCIRDMNLNRAEDRTQSRWFRIRILTKTAGRGGGKGKSEKCEIKMIGIKWSVRNETWEDKQESRMTTRNLARRRQKSRRKSKFGNKGNMFVFCYGGWDIHIKMTNG